MMSPAEQVAMLFLLEHLRPKVAIEIGTRFGGSLQVLAKNCERVCSLDIDPEVPRRLEGYIQRRIPYRAIG
jgi:cephalosporin hydroxylase